MTIKEAAQKWGVSQTTVWSYIRKGFITGIWSEKNIIHVPNISKPHIVRANMKRTEKNICNHIMNASYNFEYIDPFILGISENAFKSALEYLVKRGYISCELDGTQQSNKECKLIPEWQEVYKQKKNINPNFQFNFSLISVSMG